MEEEDNTQTGGEEWKGKKKGVNMPGKKEKRGVNLVIGLEEKEFWHCLHRLAFTQEVLNVTERIEQRQVSSGHCVIVIFISTERIFQHHLIMKLSLIQCKC